MITIILICVTNAQAYHCKITEQILSVLWNRVSAVICDKILKLAFLYCATKNILTIAQIKFLNFHKHMLAAA